MTQLKASVFVDDATLDEIRRAAFFHGMDLLTFLDSALEAGLHHACKRAESADEYPDEHPDDVLRGGAASYVTGLAIGHDAEPVAPEVNAQQLKTSFEAVEALMREPVRLRRTGESSGRVAVRLSLNEEWLIFAGWQQRMSKLQSDGRTVQCGLEGLARSPDAIAYLRAVIESDFEQAVQLMKDGHHLLHRGLYDPAYDTGDDIPF